MSDAVAKIGLALEGHPVVVAGLQQVQAQFSSLKGSVASVAAGLAAGFTVGAFVDIVKGAVESGAALHDLALQTGSTVEALSGLAAVGKYSDQTADTIGGAMNKLTRNLASATEESKGTSQAIKFLGLKLSDFKQLRPEDQMQAVAKSLAGFEDGAGKAAIMMALFGKEGAKMLPFMADLAVAGDLAAKITTEQSNAADNLDDNLLRLRTSGDAWKEELANAMIPALDQGVQALLDMTNNSGGLRDEVRRLAADGSIAQWTTAAIRAVTYVIDAFEGVIRIVESVSIAIEGITNAANAIDRADAASMTKLKAGLITEIEYIGDYEGKVNPEQTYVQRKAFLGYEKEVMPMQIRQSMAKAFGVEIALAPGAVPMVNGQQVSDEQAIQSVGGTPMNQVPGSQMMVNAAPSTQMQNQMPQAQPAQASPQPAGVF